jgi:hypothetical protein
MMSRKCCTWMLGLMLIVLLSIGPAFAAQGGAPRMSPDERLSALTTTYSLTPAQQAKIKPILADEQQKLQAAMKANPKDQAKLGKIRQDTNKKISKVLDKNQKEKFEKQMQSRPAAGQQK